MALDLYRDWGAMEDDDLNGEHMRELRCHLNRCNGILISSFVELQGLLKLELRAATVYLYTRKIDLRSLVAKAIDEHNLFTSNESKKRRFFDLREIDKDGKTNQRFTWVPISEYVLDYYEAKESLCLKFNNDTALRYLWCQERMRNILVPQEQWDHILTMGCQILPLLEMCKNGWQGDVWISFEAANAVRAAALDGAEVYNLNWRFVEKTAGLMNLYQTLISIENLPLPVVEMELEKQKRDKMMNSYKGRKVVLARNAEELLAIQPMAIMAYFKGTVVIPHSLDLDSELLDVMSKQGINFYCEARNSSRGYNPNPLAPSIDSVNDLMAVIDARTAGELSQVRSYMISPNLPQEIQHLIVEECLSREIKLSSTKLRYMFIY